MAEKTELRQWVNKIPLLELKELVYVLSEYMLDIEELKMSTNGPYWEGSGDLLFDPTDNDIEEDLITFETANLANEKGFNVWCSSAYFSTEYLGMATEIDYDTFIKDTYLAPTQSVLQKWLRKNYHIHISVEYTGQYFVKYKTGYGSTYVNCANQNFNSYEQALEYGLFEALKSIK